MADFEMSFEDRRIILTDRPVQELMGYRSAVMRPCLPEDCAKLFEIFLKAPQIKCLYLSPTQNGALQRAFTKQFTCIDAAGGVVTRDDHTILLMRRRGCWDLPKGKCEPHESYPEAALREVEEETGLRDLSIDGDLGMTHHIYWFRERWILKTTYWYAMRVGDLRQQTPQQEEGITELIWATLPQASALARSSFPPVQHAITRYVESRPVELMAP